MSVELTSSLDTPLEQAKILEGILVAAATGGDRENDEYSIIRAKFMNDPLLKSLSPEFVRKYRNLDAFWQFIKNEAGTYAERRQIIGAAFNPLMEYLEGANKEPLSLIHIFYE